MYPVRHVFFLSMTKCFSPSIGRLIEREVALNYKMGNKKSKHLIDEDKLRYTLDKDGNKVYTERIYPENWALYLKQLWASQDFHNNIRSALEMIVLGSQMELFMGKTLDLEYPFVKEAGSSVGDLLVGFNLVTPIRCIVALYIDDKHIQNIHLDAGIPVAAIGDAYPINLLHMFGSSIRLLGNEDAI